MSEDVVRVSVMGDVEMWVEVVGKEGNLSGVI